MTTYLFIFYTSLRCQIPTGHKACQFEFYVNEVGVKF